MAKKGFIIRVDGAPTDETIHRLRNFAEELFLVLRDTQLGSVENMDTAISDVHVEVSASRHMGRVGVEIKRLLRKHNFGEAAVTRR